MQLHGPAKSADLYAIRQLTATWHQQLLHIVYDGNVLSSESAEFGWQSTAKQRPTSASSFSR